MKGMKNMWRFLIHARRPKAVILMYHQVCRKTTDPWDLAVDPENFYFQLEQIRRTFEVVPLQELVACLRAKRLRKKMIAITFDDGFADNCTHAAPLLESHRLPATFYLATAALQKPQYYWWDVLEQLILKTRCLPDSFCDEIGGTPIAFQLKNTAKLTEYQIREINDWSYGKPVTNERVAFYLRLWESLKPLATDDQCAALEKVRTWAGVEAIACRHGAVLQTSQVVRLSRNPLFTFGAHTVNHTMLAAREKHEQKFEITHSKKIMEELLGTRVHGFAYPYGNFNATTKELLRESGYDHAVSTEPKAVTAGTDPYELPRLHVRNWTADQLLCNLHQILHS